MEVSKELFSHFSITKNEEPFMLHATLRHVTLILFAQKNPCKLAPAPGCLEITVDGQRAEYLIRREMQTGIMN